MSYAIVVDRDLSFDYYCKYFPTTRTDQQKGMVLLRDGSPVASVIYDNWNGKNVFMHVAAEPGRRWMTRHFLHEAFKYPFVTLGCDRITGWVESDNEDAIKFDEHLGFRREAVLSKAGEHGQDVFLYVMFREDCRYA